MASAGAFPRRSKKASNQAITIWLSHEWGKEQAILMGPGMFRWVDFAVIPLPLVPNRGSAGVLVLSVGTAWRGAPVGG
jgi:hypothetical protein